MKWATRWRRTLSDPAVYLAVRALARLAESLSPAAQGRLASLTTKALWRSSPSRRRVVLENLGLAFPDLPPEERLALGCRALRNTVLNAFELARLLQAPEALRQAVPLDAALQQIRDAVIDRPLLLVTPHLGSWELFGNAASLNGVRLSAVAHEIRNPYIDRLVRRSRTAHGIEIIPSQGAVRGIVRAVRAGRHIGLLMDQNTRPSEGGAYVDFFGLPVTVTRAPATLLRRLGLGLYVGACVRRPEGGFQVVTQCLQANPGVEGGDQALLQAIMSANEALIRRFPDQYLWTYRRWRYIPAGLPPARQRLYPFYARPEEA